VISCFSIKNAANAAHDENAPSVQKCDGFLPAANAVSNRAAEAAALRLQTLLPHRRCKRKSARQGGKAKNKGAYTAVSDRVFCRCQRSKQQGCRSSPVAIAGFVAAPISL